MFSNYGLFNMNQGIYKPTNLSSLLGIHIPDRKILEDNLNIDIEP